MRGGSEWAIVMRCKQLSERGGISVEGLDLASADEDARTELAALYDRHGLIVFRDQRLNKRELIAAADLFGGTARPAVDDCEHGYAGLTIISTRGDTGDIMPEDPDALVGDIGWHTDQGYITAPNRGKLLYAVEVPEEGGMTGFIDGEQTYAALPDALREAVEGLHVVQSWAHAQSTIARNRRYRKEGGRQLADGRFADVAYPLVVNHPRTGRPVLNAPPLWAASILERPGSDGDALLAEIIAHIGQRHFAYWHSYRLGDVVLWDNWRFAHAASGTLGRYRRTLWSVIVQGGPTLGREIGHPNSTVVRAAR